MTTRRCKVCDTLPPDILKRVDFMLLSKVQTSEVVAYVTGQKLGGSLTTRNYTDHTRHAKHEVLIESDRATLETSNEPNLIDTAWTAEETLEALYTAKVEQVNRLKTQCEKFPSLRAEEQLARAVIELEVMVVSRDCRQQNAKKAEAVAAYEKRNKLCFEAGLLPIVHETLEKDLRLDGCAIVPNDSQSYLYEKVPSEKLLGLLKEVYQQNT